MTNAQSRSARHGRSLSGITALYFSAGMLVLIAVCIVTYGALTSFAETEARVARTHQIQAKIGNLQRNILEAMVARRAYASDGSAAHVTTFRNAAIRARDELAALAQLTRDNPEQRNSVQELQRLLVAPLTKAAQIEDTPLPAVEAPSAAPPAPPPTGQNSSEVLLTLLGRISDEEQNQLRGREEAAQRHFKFARSAVPIGTIASILLLTSAVVMLNREVRERRRAEATVRELNDALDARVRDRTAQLEEAVKELDAFSYSVSHDLRAPLRHVQGYAAKLEREFNGQLTDSSKRFLSTINNSCVEMGQLIDDLLEFSRMGRIELTESHVPLDEVLAQTVRSMEISTRDRRIVWKIAPLPVVLGDASMLRRVFDNLIGNAIKYTRRCDAAEIEVGCRGEEDGRIVVYVRDNGAGFDMQYVQKLFGVFQRLHRSDEFEGTGIGLAIVHRVISRHGGRVWAHGEIGHGATFYLTLRLAASEIAALPS